MSDVNLNAGGVLGGLLGAGVAAGVLIALGEGNYERWMTALRRHVSTAYDLDYVIQFLRQVQETWMITTRWRNDFPGSVAASVVALGAPPGPVDAA